MVQAQIGPYLIRGEIGRGGMGIVYLARDTELDRDVAIKALPADRARDPEWLRQLVREAQALGRLNHPNVAQIHSMEVVEGARYLVIEYVPGETLRQVLRSDPPGFEISLRFCLQIASGLEAAHNRGVVHRDLKPENVRIRRDGVVKIIDFGLAVSRPETAGSYAARTDPGARADAETLGRLTTEIPEQFRWAGTPGYMSPEQIRGRPADKRSDIFSFGCVFYECLAGAPVFHGRNVREVAEAVVLEDPDWAKLPGTTPVGIRSLLSSCLEKDRGARLADLGPARIAIEGALDPHGDHGAIAPCGPQTVRNNIPSEVNTFIGREAVIARLLEGVRSNRLLTLTGTGGCGKTRLARSIARAALALHPGGVWIVELAGVTDPAHLSGSIGQTLNAPAEGGGISAATLASLVADSRILLILDNCEHLVEGCRSLVDHLLRRCPNLRMMVTSQEILGLPGEFVFPVPSLGLPGLEEEADPRELARYESVRLFVDRAKLARPGFELTPANGLSVARICRRLDGIPLAIELAAARLKALSVRQIETRLDDLFQLLTGGSPLALERHRTLLATMEWSFGLLSEREGRTMRELSVFAGGWSLEAAAAVCSEMAGEITALDLLARLVERSLIVPDDQSGTAPEPRYQMLETMRLYCQSRMSEGEEREARNRHLAYFADLAERSQRGPGGIGRDSWLDILTHDGDNLRQALRWSLDAGPAGQMQGRPLAAILGESAA